MMQHQPIVERVDEVVEPEQRPGLPPRSMSMLLSDPWATLHYRPGYFMYLNDSWYIFGCCDKHEAF